MARADDSLLFCNLPPRKSVTGLQEQPRLSYYNGNELQAVPFKWEASPGKPIVAESQHEPPGERFGLRLPPPPGAPPGGRRNRHIDEINRLSNKFARSNVISVSSTPEQKPGCLPPKVKTGSSAEGTAATNVKSATAVVPAVPLAFAKPGHRRAFQSNDSVTTASARSDFDWPEVSDDEEEQPCTPPGHNNSSRDPEVHQHAIFGRPKEESFSSSRSSDDGSNSFASSSPVNSGGSRGSGGSGGSGGSARDLLLWRNLVRIAAATDVPPAAANAVPSKPPSTYGGDSEDDDDDDVNHARPMPRGLFACMPIFSRVRFIQSQLSKCEKDIPGVLDFSRRLPPRSKNKVYRS